MVFLEISLRYFRQKKGKGGISLISFVSMAGIMLGVIALCIVISVMNGFDKELKKRILGVVPHLVVESPFANEDLIKAGIDPDAPILASGLFLQIQGMLVSHSGNELVKIYGVIPGEEEKMSLVSQYMVAGDMSLLVPGNSYVLLGRPLAFRLGLGVGDGVTLVMPGTTKSGRSIRPKLFNLEIAGLFELGSELDYGLGLMHLKDVEAVSALKPWMRFKLADVFDADGFAKNIRNHFQVDVLTWGDEYGDFFQTVKMEKIMMFILMAVIIAIAAFNIVSSLSIMVVDKKSDIAILRTMGANSRQIMSIFMVQGMLTGLVGLLLGLAIGVPLAQYITEVVSFFEDVLSSRVLSGTYFDRVPSDVRLRDLMVISLFSLLVSFLATIRPAIKASKLQPAAILRTE